MKDEIKTKKILQLENGSEVAAIISRVLNKTSGIHLIESISVHPFPKVKMAQVGGRPIVGERISSEPIIDRFGNIKYIHSEGRIIKEIR
ncbi:hypothetical protein [Flavobacterium sp.]|uniref:hypothetical protein n=1 Tax=Flavobacterium sp. TaxID=239 RepID=UPI00260C6A2A|nr:hypothetical protein [Flavobacterium sp.]